MWQAEFGTKSAAPLLPRKAPGQRYIKLLYKLKWPNLTVQEVLPVKRASAHAHPRRSRQAGSWWTFEKPSVTLKDFLSPANFHRVRKNLHYNSYITKQFIEVTVTSHFNCCYLFRQQSQGRACQHQEKRKSSMLLKSEFHFKQNKQRHPDHYMRKFHMNRLLHFCSPPPLALLTSLLAKKIKKSPNHLRYCTASWYQSVRGFNWKEPLFLYFVRYRMEFC